MGIVRLDIWWSFEFSNKNIKMVITFPDTVVGPTGRGNQKKPHA